MATVDDAIWMREALSVAGDGLRRGELPIGAIVVVETEIVGRAHTQELAQGRLLVHAELLALDEADRILGFERHKARLYTNLEPCLGCLGSAMTMMVPTIVYGLESPTDGAVTFAEHWNDERDRNGFPGYRLPAMRSGVLRSESIDLFRRYILEHPDASPMTDWARTLIDL